LGFAINCAMIEDGVYRRYSTHAEISSLLVIIFGMGLTGGGGGFSLLPSFPSAGYCLHGPELLNRSKLWCKSALKFKYN
jgi:hypothetical protein